MEKISYIQKDKVGWGEKNLGKHPDGGLGRGNVSFPIGTWKAKVCAFVMI